MVPIPWHFQPANQKVEPNHQKKALGTEKQNASISEKGFNGNWNGKAKGKGWGTLYKYYSPLKGTKTSG